MERDFVRFVEGALCDTISVINSEVSNIPVREWYFTMLSTEFTLPKTQHAPTITVRPAHSATWKISPASCRSVRDNRSAVVLASTGVTWAART